MVFFTALLSSASPIKTISDVVTVAEVALLGAIVRFAAPEVAPPDKPEVPAVFTAVISPSDAAPHSIALPAAFVLKTVKADPKADKPVPQCL